MKSTVFDEGDSVLLVGEGNFTFSVALYQLCQNINITATCYESTVDSAVGKKNIEYLLNNDVRVLLGVDATKLMEHPVLSAEKFNKIIFNFPHVGGKMRIEKNRELLKKFFIASEKFIKHNGLILVTLCNGQGGVPLDNPVRRYDDTWKVIEMAAHGNFVLRVVEPFTWCIFKSYTVTGYRSLEKTFCTDGALTYHFQKAEPPTLQNIAAAQKINVPTNALSISWKNLFTSSQSVCDSLQCSLSLYPPSFSFDITFSINDKFSSTKFYELLYNYAGCIIDDVQFVGKYVSPINKSETQTYRITYKSHMLPLYRKRVIELHQTTITNLLEQNLNVVVTK